MKANMDKADNRYLVAALARTKLRYGTKEPEIGLDGQGSYLVDLVVFGEDTDIITVRIAGEPKVLTKGDEVKVVGLVMSTWEKGDRAGISYRADSITAVSTKSSTTATA
ncbi:MAG: hypothetical protein ACYC0I_06515 [Acidimicrobiales bacterium]